MPYSTSEDAITKAGAMLQKRHNVKHVLITLGEAGMLLLEQGAEAVPHADARAGGLRRFRRRRHGDCGVHAGAGGRRDRHRGGGDRESRRRRRRREARHGDAEHGGIARDVCEDGGAQVNGRRSSRTTCCPVTFRAGGTNKKRLPIFGWDASGCFLCAARTRTTSCPGYNLPEKFS